MTNPSLNAIKQPRTAFACDAETFKKKLKDMIGTTRGAYHRYAPRADEVYGNYDFDSILQLLQVGDPLEVRELSRFFYRCDGIYRRVLSFYAHLLLFFWIAVPHIEGTISKSKQIKRYNAVLRFLQNMNIQSTFTEITEKILVDGAFYGLLRTYANGAVTLQRLPLAYCRTRYKNPFGVDILELDLRYFDKLLSGSDEAEEVYASFPANIMLEYDRFKAGKRKTYWMEVPDSMGVAFYFSELIPFFAPALPTMLRLEEAQEREIDRDEEELQKILINRMPISNKTDEPVFSLEETAVIHEGLADMLGDNKYIDVLTTFGDASLEQAQDNTGQAQRNSLTKFTSAVYNMLGVSQELFNATGNTALKYSVDKDTSLMYGFTRKFSDWLTYILNLRFGDNKMDFTFQFLPITQHNMKDMMDTYLKGAQYGYSKLYVAVAQGISQYDLMSLVQFENEILNLDEEMIPLQSSHTASAQNSDGKSGNSGKSGDNKSEPGRPELSDGDKTDKTIANRDSM